MEKNMRYVLLMEIIMLCLMMTACGPNNAAADATEIIPSVTSPVSNQPATPAQPVLISEPVGVIVTTPETTTPAVVSSVEPTVIGTIEPTETTPAAQIIELETPAQVVDVQPVSEPTPSVEVPAVAPITLPELDPTLVATPAPAPVGETPAVQPIPPAIVAVAVTIPEPVVTPAPVEDSIVDVGSGDGNDQDPTYINLQGSCFGKKNAGFIWYHKKFPSKKKNGSVSCSNGNYNVRIKIKKKDLNQILVQTLFFD